MSIIKVVLAGNGSMGMCEFQFDDGDGWDSCKNVTTFIFDDGNGSLDVSASTFDDGDCWDGETNAAAFLLPTGMAGLIKQMHPDS